MPPLTRLRTVLLLAFACVAVLPVLMVGFLSVNYLGERLSRSIDEKNLLLGRVVAEEIHGFLSHPLFVLNHLRDELAGSRIQPSQHSDILQRAVDSAGLFESIYLLDSRGIIRSLGLSKRFPADIRDYLGLDLSGQPFFQAPASSLDPTAPYWSDVFVSNLTGRPSVTLSITLSSGRLVGTFDLLRLRRIIENLRGGEEVSARLLDSRGILIFSREGDWALTQRSLRHLEVVREGLSGREGTYRYEEHDVEHLGSILSIPETGWMLLVSQDAADAFEPVNNLRRTILIGMLAALCMALFISVGAARSILAPLFRLTEEANRIAQGNYQVRLLRQPFAEMEVFVRAFRTMVSAISDREASLRRSEERYRLLFDSANDFIFVYPIPRDRELVHFYEVNEAACRRLGYSREEILKMTPLEICRRPLGAEVRSGAQRSLVFETEVLSLHREAIPVEVSAHLFEMAGELMVLEICRDISERRQQQRVLTDLMGRMRLANEKLDGILRSVPGALVVTDAAGSLMMLNAQAEELFGIDQEQVLGVPVGAALPDRRLGDALMSALKFELDEHCFDFEMPAGEPGRTRVLRGRTTLIRQQDRRPSGMVSILIDVTHEREIERMKSEFVSTAAHELRTPLTAILGFSELLLTRDRFEEEQKRTFLGHIHAKSLSLTEILDNLLDLSRIESGLGLALRKTCFELRPLLERMVQLYAGMSAKHRFEIRVEDPDAKLCADQGKVEQVLENLLSNAVKYSPGGGAVEIEAKRVDAGCLLCIRDAGIGMTAEQSRRCFEKFYRADASNAAIEGTGLGMAIIKAIVDSHGGRIDINSVPGAGTTVSVFFPDY